MKQIDKHVYRPWALVTGASSGIGEEFDDLDIGLLVSNAGAGQPGPFISLPDQRLREIGAEGSCSSRPRCSRRWS